MTTTSQTLVKFQRALAAFRMLLPDGTMNHLYLFLEIANEGGPIETRDLPDRLHMTQTTINRTMHTLADGSYVRPDGLRLVKVSVSAYDARQRVVQLTPRGQQVAANLREILNG